jgi:cystathionine beta-lyase family protein involved in aluminum resistance
MSNIVDINYEYLIIDCGYHDRLAEYAEKIKEMMEEEFSGYGFDDEGDWEDERGQKHFADHFPSLLCIRNRRQKKVFDIYKYTDKKHEEHIGVTKKLYKSVGKDSTGGIFFYCTRTGDAMIIMKILMKFRHCACFGFGALSSMQYITKEGHTALYMHFDTESG